ncbi:MAG: hypothetical protein E6772_07495 [Dysgonomonas sp.]|nr:hypothetical protein [Dysgonomonas sp.]
MKKVFSIISAMALVITMNSCGNDDDFTPSTSTPTPPIEAQTFTKAVKAYNEDQTESIEIEVIGNNQETLDNYLATNTFLLVKESDVVERINNNLQNTNAAESDETGSTSEKEITLAIKNEVPAGYTLVTEQSETSLKAAVAGYLTYLNVTNRTGRTITVYFRSSTMSYAGRAVAKNRTIGHPQNGRYGYKYARW